MIDKLEKDEQAKIADAQRSLLGEPVAIVRLCRDFGIRVAEADDLPKDTSGFIRKNDNGTFDIGYNGKEPATRQRFTVAHELAHYLLHRDLMTGAYPENVMLRSGRLTNKHETQANKLAAEILMPYAAIDEYIETRRGFSIVDMAKDFGVSASALAIRLGTPLDI